MSRCQWKGMSSMASIQTDSFFSELSCSNTSAVLLLCHVPGMHREISGVLLLTSFLKLLGRLQAHFFFPFFIFLHLLLDKTNSIAGDLIFFSAQDSYVLHSQHFVILRFKGSKPSDKHSLLTINVSQTIIMIVPQVEK